MAALEFSQLPPNRKGAGTWQPRGGGPGLRAEGRGGAAALSPPGRQSFRKRSEDPPGRASKGWGNPAKPAGATAGGTTLPGGQGRSGAQLGTLFAKDRVGLAKGAFPADEAVPADEKPQVFPGHRVGPAAPRSLGPGQPVGVAGGQRPKAEGKEEPLLPGRQQEGEGGSPPTAGRRGGGRVAPQPGSTGGKEEVQVLTEELNRRGLAYVWGLMGLPGGWPES